MSLEAWGDENPDDADYYSWSERAMEAGWVDLADYSPGVIAILQERERQETKEGWTPEHDDEHTSQEIAVAAMGYLSAVVYPDEEAWTIDEQRPPGDWPWGKSWWKPDTDRRMLVKAGALIAAEIDRMDRAAMRDSTPLSE